MRHPRFESMLFSNRFLEYFIYFLCCCISVNYYWFNSIGNMFNIHFYLSWFSFQLSSLTSIHSSFVYHFSLGNLLEIFHYDIFDRILVFNHTLYCILVIPNFLSFKSKISNFFSNLWILFHHNLEDFFFKLKDINLSLSYI